MRRIGVTLMVLLVMLTATVAFADTRPSPGPWPEAQP